MIRVNCVGLGHWGPNLVRNFVGAPETCVGMVCDVSEQRLRLLRTNIPGVQGFSTDPQATVSDPQADAIVIATPVASHYELAKQALLAGKHVLVEKPLCHTTAQGRELIEIAEKAKKLLCVGHIFLFNNGVRAVRNLIRSGDLGRIHYACSVRTNLGPFRADVNALWDLASHDLSIFNFWFDAGPTSVTASGAAYLNSTVEDVVLASFSYPPKVLAHVHASWLNPRKVREITVVGEHKMVVWNDMDLNEPLRIYHKSVDIEREPVYSDTFGQFRMQIRHGEIVIPHVGGQEPLAVECRHFLDCVAGRAQPVNGARDALRVVAALEAADRSLREHSAIVPVADPCQPAAGGLA
jgi:predicted dehydrogenase